MSKEKAIEKLREILDRDDLCPKCNIRKRVIEEAIRELETDDGNVSRNVRHSLIIITRPLFLCEDA